MNTLRPKVTVIIPTYNRAHVIERPLKSLLNQTIDNVEIVVVDDGSSDDTDKILENYMDRLTLVKHETNKGVCAAKNTGLDHIHGEWFTILDSDDEITPDALETLLAVPEKVDPSINAVTCNCIDTSTGKFSGIGLYQDQYVTPDIIVSKLKGEFWGIIKTELLGSKRFNEDLPGFMNVLWYQIDVIARRYYIHKALRTYYTDANDRVTTKKRVLSIEKRAKVYNTLAEEVAYWNIMKQYNLKRFQKECVKAILFLSATKQNEASRFYQQMLGNSGKLNFRFKLLSVLPKYFGGTFLSFILHSYARFNNWQT